VTKQSDEIVPSNIA